MTSVTLLVLLIRFSRGSTESHNISGQDLGRLVSVRLGHDDSGFSSAWLPTKVNVLC